MSHTGRFACIISLLLGTAANATPADATKREPSDACRMALEKMNLPRAKAKLIPVACAGAATLETCKSRNGTPIFHLDRTGTGAPESKQRILVFSLMHGDEGPSGVVAASWMQRLTAIEPRNDWRIVPVVNPDGWELKTRTNAAGVDVNRNFPSRGWEDEAIKTWRTKNEANPRRFPGDAPASEPETLCAMKQIDDFKPDFVISIHTPLGVLDFDGPRVPPPKFSPLKWVSLGNYPGSLGRYMWVDRGIPVLTVELKSQLEADRSLEQFDRLQDVSGTVALDSRKALLKKGRVSIKGG